MPIRWHSLWRGIQSVIFYYLTCTPYLKFANRRTRKKQGKRAELEQAALRLEAPDAYRHPLPFNTNEHWAEEIRLGPGPPPNRLSKKQRLALAQLRPVDDNSAGHTPINDRSMSKLDLAGGEKTNPNSTEVERWRTRQRDDEPLWGCEDKYAPSSSLSTMSGKTNGSSVRFPPYDPGENSSAGFIVAVNPPISELHPPVVSNPAQGNISNMWMLQPPPKAAVMSGHDSASNRSRSTTASSLSSRRTGELRLGRKLSDRLMEEKLRRGNLLYPNDHPRPLYQDLPSQSSLIEAKYFDVGISRRTSTRMSQTSTDTVNIFRSLTIDGEQGDDSRLPWQRHDYRHGTTSKDFAVSNMQRADTISHPSPSAGPYRSKHRPRTAPRTIEFLEALSSGESIPSESLPSARVARNPKSRRKHQELLDAMVSQGQPFTDQAGLGLHDGQLEMTRRRSVDF